MQLNIKSKMFEVIPSIKFFSRLSGIGALVSLYWVTNYKEDPAFISQFIMAVCSFGFAVSAEYFLKPKSNNTYYHYLAPFNYFLGVTSLVYWLFLSSVFPLGSLIIFLFTVPNFCFTLSLSNYDYTLFSMHDCYKLFKRSDNLDIHVALFGNQKILSNVGVVTFGFGDVFIDNKQYNIYEIIQYLEDNKMSMAKMTQDDIVLIDMLNY